eukprot:2826808-Pleurochrysis_carterae.AAC.1
MKENINNPGRLHMTGCTPTRDHARKVYMLVYSQLHAALPAEAPETTLACHAKPFCMLKNA